jgi:cell division transport system permease protein
VSRNRRSPLQHLRFFVADAWDEWRHSPGVNLLALLTLSAALFLAGLVLLALDNVEGNVQRLQADVRVEVYLDDEITTTERAVLVHRLETTGGVDRVVHIDKARALVLYREWAGDMAPLIEELQTNPLPASLQVFLSPGPDAESRGSRIARELAGQPGVEEARFNRRWLERLASLLDLARVGGSGLALLVFGAVVFVMASVLRLAVYARQEEIEIMLLVGATPGFVRGPFLVAGLAQGVISSALALGLVEIARRAVLFYGGAGSTTLLEMVSGRPLGWLDSILLLGIGVGVSLAGSWLAVRRSFDHLTPD